MFPGLNDADCLAAGMRHGELLAEATRNRSAGGRNLDHPARTRGFGAARNGIGTLIAGLVTRPLGTPEAGGTTGAPPTALGSTR